MGFLDYDGLLHFWLSIKPKFADATHTHAIADTTGLQAALDGKASTGTATTDAAGLMSAADKSKLDGIAEGADKSDAYTKAEVDERLNGKASLSDIKDKAAFLTRSHMDASLAQEGIATPLDYADAKMLMANAGMFYQDGELCVNVLAMAEVINALCAQIDVNATTAAGKADATHTHAIADTTGLQAALDGKAAVGHKHVIADVDGLQAALDSKAAADATDADGSKASRVSPLASKRVLVMGDSISTDAYANYHKWVTDLVEDGTLTSSNVTNNSYSATGFVHTYDESGKVVYGNFVDRLKAVTDTSYDIVVTFGGINDYIGAIAWDAFTAAVDSYFSDLTTRFLDARLVVLTPLRTYNVYKNKAGHYQTEYSDYIKQVARSYCLPVLDLTYESGFYPFVDAFKKRWTLVPSGYTSADGVHPNLEYGKKFLAPMIRGFLEGLYASDEIELTGYYTQAEVDELVASGGVKFHWDAGERTAATIVRGNGLSVGKYYTNFNANTGGGAGAITSYAVDETSVTVNSPTYYGGVMVPFEVEPGKTYRLTCDIPFGLLSWGELRDLGVDAEDVVDGNLYGFHANAKPTWLSNNWSESGGTQSFDIKPTTPYIYIAFGNSDKKPVTWSNIKFVKRG